MVIDGGSGDGEGRRVVVVIVMVIVMVVMMNAMVVMIVVVWSVNKGCVVLIEVVISDSVVYPENGGRGDGGVGRDGDIRWCTQESEGVVMV